MSRAPPRPPRASAAESGVALILVLWILALVAALVLAFLGGARTALRIAQNDDAAAHAEALAESGVTLAILALASPTAPWAADGAAHRVSYGDGAIEIRVEDENGKIDLNVAPPELFIGLFRALGAKDAEATGIAAAIIDWRSGVDIANAGSATATTARQFLDVSELAQIPGVSRDLYRRAAPFLTVYSFSPYVNPLTAPAEVLQSLPGVDPDAIPAFLASRAEANGNPAALPPLPGAGDIAVSPVTTVMITAQARTKTGARFTRVAVVSLAARPNAPLSILAWGTRHSEPAPAPGR